MVNHKLGWFYEGQGNYATALPWFEQNVTLLKSRLGDRHPDVAQSLDNLAELYRNLAEKVGELKNWRQNSLTELLP